VKAQRKRKYLLLLRIVRVVQQYDPYDYLKGVLNPNFRPFSFELKKN